MDILNFISWIRGRRVVNSVDPNKTLLPVALQDDRRDDEYLTGAISVQNFTTQVAANIPAGAQGPIGPQGVPGPVGPAGLNWQGSWSAAGVYVLNDAVGFGGASYFCINPVGPSPTNPATDPLNWALLASQGATGPQGPQGIQGPVGPAGSSNPNFSVVPSGLVSASSPFNTVVSFSTIPANTFNNSIRPIFAIKTALQKVASANTMVVRVYISNNVPFQGIDYFTAGATLIAEVDTATNGSGQKIVKIEKDVFFSGSFAQFLPLGLPSDGFSDSGIGANAATYNSSIFDNSMSVGTIDWTQNIYVVVTVQSSATDQIGARYLSVVRI
jgi:hypothetical protein